MALIGKVCCGTRTGSDCPHLGPAQTLMITVRALLHFQTAPVNEIMTWYLYARLQRSLGNESSSFAFLLVEPHVLSGDFLLFEKI